jgi:hypothetical protein
MPILWTDDKANQGDRLPTWDQIVRLALHDPAIHAAVTRYSRGDVTREQVLMMAVVVLSQQRQVLHDELVRLKQGGR